MNTPDVEHTNPKCPRRPTPIMDQGGRGPCLCITPEAPSFDPRDVAPAEDVVFKDRAKDGKSTTSRGFR